MAYILLLRNEVWRSRRTRLQDAVRTVVAEETGRRDALRGGAMQGGLTEGAEEGLSCFWASSQDLSGMSLPLTM